MEKNNPNWIAINTLVLKAPKAKTFYTVLQHLLRVNGLTYIFPFTFLKWMESKSCKVATYKFKDFK